MSKPTNKQICEAWDRIEEDDPDISTEQIFSRVCDFFKHEIDNGDVAASLAEQEGLEPA